MSNEVLVLVVFLLLFGALAIGVQLGLAMAGSAFAGLALQLGVDSAMALVGRSIYEAALSFELSVIPLFVLMGVFAARARISVDLYEAFHVWLANRRGGLAQASLAACAAFGAVCGSSMATAATLGKVALPEMRRYGYSMKLATGSIAAGGTIGILIPPSVVMAVYGILTETSIGDLFIAGILPGIVLASAFMVTVSITVRLKPSSAPDARPQAENISGSPLRKVWSTALLFLVVIGGIYAGIFTPTEAAGIGAVGALVIGISMRRLAKPDYLACLSEALTTTSMIFMILIGAIIFTRFITLSGLPYMLGSWVEDLHLTPLATILLIAAIYVLMGAFLDTMAMVLLSTPVFFPIVMNMGFDPVWFGILVVLLVELALITPPLGLNVFVIRALEVDTPLSHIFQGVIPFCIALLCVVALVIAVPELVTWLPHLAAGGR